MTACTKTRNSGTKKPKRNNRNKRNDQNETIVTTKTKRPKRSNRNDQNGTIERADVEMPRKILISLQILAFKTFKDEGLLTKLNSLSATRTV